MYYYCEEILQMLSRWTTCTAELTFFKMRLQDKDGLTKTLERMLEPNQQDIQGLPASTVQYSTGKDFFLIF